MTSQKTTCLIHIYNEEYLLPFWLYNHKDIFDDILIIDYRSTDKSIEICKKICPNCKIITTINEYFGAHDIDKEIMDLEQKIEGIKIVLNVTEFLFCERPIKDIFMELGSESRHISLSIKCVSPYSKKFININNNYELLMNLMNNDIISYNIDRSNRYIHNYPCGNYTVGRHTTQHHTYESKGIHIIWLGFFPLNERLLQRKLQIKNNMPESDKKVGFGFQHLYSKEEMLIRNNECLKRGVSLKNINIDLYNLLSVKITDKSLKTNLYLELLADNDWGNNSVMLDNDINLLKNTDFDFCGYKILNIENYNKLLQNFIRNEIYFVTKKYINLTNYHNEITDDEHTLILNSMPYKKNMYPDVCEFCNYLESYISHELKEPIKILNDDLWFRICRPSKVSENDFNPCHRDVYLDFYRNTVNIYLPVIGSNDNSSLKIQPGSHKWPESETIVTKGGAFFKSTNKKYSVDAIVASKQPLEMLRPNPNEDQLMLFSPYLIHGCADNNNENTTRISLEIRFIRNDENGIKQETDLNEFLKTRHWR
jgi:hypothetical protein